MPETLLQTKLYAPPLRPNLVSRPRLIRRLNRGLEVDKKLTLVSAPAGFGKTTLITEWRYRIPDSNDSTSTCQDPRFGWLSLDEGDNDPIQFLSDMGSYLMGEMGYELATNKLPKMRVIPVEESVQIEHRVATYDELRHVIKQAGDHIAVQDCICKEVNDLQGKSCLTTDRREVCMSLGYLVDLYVEEGWGRRINQEEALEFARKSEEEGLVIMPGNEQEPAFMCACCSDCCGMMMMMKAFPNPADAVASNYYVQVNTELCTGVGTCVDRCPMGAVFMDDGHADVKLNRCIGCGLCVPVCPEDAITLVKKEKEYVPPLTEEQLFDEILAYRSSLSGKIRIHSMKTLLRIASRFSNN